ncbi:U-box domain-containing protein 52-like [Chenopodium quinoa]|nr:U-box domain-containing protein 52-like [Chenopodium quinoa]
MWLSKENSDKRNTSNQLVAVAIDRDKGSQHALKWAIDNLLQRGQTVVLVHVKVRPSYGSSPHIVIHGRQWDQQTKDLFLPFRCFCTRKDIQCRDIVLEDSDVQKALIEFVTQSAVEVLIMGASSRNSILSKFTKTDTPTAVSKGVPEFCSVYVISKVGKISNTRSASRPPPIVSPLRNQIMNQPTSAPVTPPRGKQGLKKTTPSGSPFNGFEDIDFKSTFTRGGRHPHVRSYGDILSDNDISFVSSGRASVDRTLPSTYDVFEERRSTSTNRLSSSSENDYMNETPQRRSFADTTPLSSPPPNFSNYSFHDNSNSNWSSNTQSQSMDDVEAQMRKLKMELAQTMNMYSSVCKEALTAKQKALDLQRWKVEEERRMDEAQDSEESTQTSFIEKNKAKSKASIEASEAHKRLLELEAQKRISAEMKALKEVDEKNKDVDRITTAIRYRKYTIEEIEVATEYFAEARKIGEGGYGPVFRCHLDHTVVAVKVLRPDAAQGRSQFQQEVEVLSCIRHPNMVLLLGACPEYGCLVYEYMHNGSLEDRLFRRGQTMALSWQHRFRIAAEIATGLLFLHQTKPEPLVHRDLKPANILLDRNLVAKISDVGLARLVPPSVADEVTQYRMTSTAGTFCYIDPEYQQTGMLGVKSDVYSLGIILLQLITAKSPMGLTHHVERAIEKGTFKDILDKEVTDWPIEEALKFAKLSLQCAELRRRDRPDLGTIVLPQLCFLRNMAEESLDAMTFRDTYGSYNPKSSNSQVSDSLSSAPSHESWKSSTFSGE